MVEVLENKDEFDYQEYLDSENKIQLDDEEIQSFKKAFRDYYGL